MKYLGVRRSAADLADAEAARIRLRDQAVRITELDRAIEVMRRELASEVRRDVPGERE